MKKQAKSKELTIQVPAGCDLQPDNASHTNRMEIRSESSDRLYIVAQAKDSGEWQCSCPGWIFKRAGKERNCKHLRAIIPALGVDQYSGPIVKLTE